MWSTLNFEESQSHLWKCEVRHFRLGLQIGNDNTSACMTDCPKVGVFRVKWCFKFAEIIDSTGLLPNQCPSTERNLNHNINHKNHPLASSSTDGFQKQQKLHALICQAFVCMLKHTHPFNGPLSWTTQVSRYQKGKTNLDFTKAKRQRVAVASAGPYASLHLAPDIQPCRYPTAQFFYRPDALPAAQPTASKHWRHNIACSNTRAQKETNAWTTACTAANTVSYAAPSNPPLKIFTGHTIFPVPSCRPASPSPPQWLPEPQKFDPLTDHVHIIL